MSGYLAPIGPAPSSDQELDVVLQAAVVGITGLPGNLVRPRWQKLPPTQPAHDTNWAAIAVTQETPDQYAHLRPDPADETLSIQQRHWTMLVLVSFYGPAASAYVLRLRNGLLIPQNLEVLRDNNIAFQEGGDGLVVPELINQQWYRRVDVQLTFRRMVEMRYAIARFASAPLTLTPNS